MPAAEPRSETYWDEGYSALGVRNSPAVTGSELFWDEGFSAEDLFPLKYKSAFFFDFDG